MERTLSLIGFGEAGMTFACASGWKSAARAFDVKTRGEGREAKLADYEFAGVIACETSQAALHHASAIISVVTADEALNAAQDAAGHLAKAAYFFDMNSVAPQTKICAARAVEDAGARYIDAAIMAPVDPARLSVPLLLSGPHAEAGAEVLASLGFTNVRAVSGPVGRASTVKMIRSVMVKGIEALTAECLTAAVRADVIDDVFASLGREWPAAFDYQLGRMMHHGLRRAAEMEEVVKTLEALDMEADMSRGAARQQRAIGNIGADPVPRGLAAKLEMLRDV